MPIDPYTGTQIKLGMATVTCPNGHTNLLDSWLAAGSRCSYPGCGYVYAPASAEGAPVTRIVIHPTDIKPIPPADPLITLSSSRASDNGRRILAPRPPVTRWWPRTRHRASDNRRTLPTPTKVEPAPATVASARPISIEGKSAQPQTGWRNRLGRVLLGPPPAAEPPTATITWRNRLGRVLFGPDWRNRMRRYLAIVNWLALLVTAIYTFPALLGGLIGYWLAGKGRGSLRTTLNWSVVVTALFVAPIVVSAWFKRGSLLTVNYDYPQIILWGYLIAATIIVALVAMLAALAVRATSRRKRVFTLLTMLVGLTASVAAAWWLRP